MELFSANIIENRDVEAAQDTVLRVLNIQNTENNPDIMVLSKPDKKTTIPIETIREAREWINVKPYKGDRKYLMIKHAHKLGAESQNALLKTLEEPPAYAVIILITTSADALLDTVISRCKIIKQHVITDNQDSQNTNRLAIKDITRMNIGEIIDYTEQNKNNLTERKDVIKWMESLELELHKAYANPNKPDYYTANMFKLINSAKRDIESTNVGLTLSVTKLLLDLKKASGNIN